MKHKTYNNSTEHSLLELQEIILPFSKEETIVCPQFLVKVSCGLFGISDDFIDKYQSLDQLFIRNKYSTFFFECSGDSMEPTIKNGQLLIVDRSIKDFHRRVCIVVYEDKLVCKRVYLGNDSVILKSDNPKYKDIVIKNEDSTLFWGVVTGVAGFIK